MKEFADIQAVIFDMDGLLLDTERMYRSAWQRAAKECGFELTNEGHTNLLGRGRKGATTILSQMAGESFQLEKFIGLLPQVEAEIFGVGPLPLKTGVHEILTHLKKQQLKLAVATSTVKEKAVKRLEAVNLHGYFEAIVGGDEVVKSKPEPDIYILTATRLAVEPTRCLVLEDSETGITAANKAGMRACMVPDLKQPSPEIREITTAIFDSLDQLRLVFEKS